MKKILLLIIMLKCVSHSIAQNETQQDIVNKTFGGNPELYFSFPLQSQEIMLKLTRIISIDNVKNNEVIAVANRKEFENFLEFNIPYTILPSPFEMLPHEARVMTEDMTNKSTYAWDAYPTYQAYLDMMAQFAIDYPALCRIDTIGYSVQGRLLLSAVISDNVHTDEDEPEFFYSSTMHGDETVGYILMLRLIDYLLSNYGTNPEVTNIVNSIEIYINPNANPDGTYYGGNSTVTAARRNNYNNYDLNRNFPDPTGDQNPGGTRQIETQYFMDYALERDFVMSANFHGGAELSNYPWDYTTTNHPDKQWWIMISTEYAASAQNNSPSGYFDDYYSGFDSPGVTEGASWYIVYGSRQDYALHYAYDREITIEVSATKNPAASNLPNYWNYNYQALILCMKQVLYGFRGIVTDACTNDPVKAKIELIGHDAMNSHVFSSLPAGNYHRPVKAGTYTIRASAPGYIDQQYTNVSVTEYNTVIRNFQMVAEPPVVQFTANTLYSCAGTIEFVNNSTAPQDVVYTWHFGDGTTSNDVNPVHTYSSGGIYTVKLYANTCAGTDSLIRNDYIEIALNVPPIADFVSGNLTPNLNATVAFTDLSECIPTGWLWNFSPSGAVIYLNGTDSTSQNPMVSFSQTGLYTVSLTASNGNGNHIVTKTNYINVTNFTYCTLTATNLSDEWISDISFAGIQNSSVSTGYSDFRHIAGNVNPDSAYAFSGTISMTGSGWSEYVSVWIDWDQDGTFGINERYQIGSCSSNGCMVSNTITVPSGALPGTTVMRVALLYNSFRTDPCDSYTYGEVEDYSVNVLPVITCADFEETTNATVCNGDSVVWRGTGYSISGTYYDSLLTTNPAGCDSVYVLNLTVNPAYHYYEEVIVLDADLPYIWYGDSYFAPGTYFKNYQSMNGCDSIYEMNLIVMNLPVLKTLNLTVLLEGLCSETVPGMMNQAMNGTFPQFSGGFADVITIELYNATDVSQRVYLNENVMLDTNGNAIIEDINSGLLGSYYVVVKHRNSIETWSALPLSFAGTGPFYYNLTNTASAAFGNNLKPVAGGLYAIYGGDASQDGIVDGSDMSLIDNAGINLLTGYLFQDINGDGVVDGSDMLIIDNNSSILIQKQVP